ncbi:TetR/AcrR family transcriptional regulator [Streptomyces kutzneri]|uniref:TetR/AcrR family transcriptional regulator n=1 Tax=Streptomyces kutzneri TaxID=3051179 RepID=UPI0028D82D17|nr:TetR/AcrR family transcriptional regulator [Streptomyces sp. DSM 40907]
MDLSPQRARTRQAILDAAAARWARDPTVGLGDIAAAACVGRATLHRYFSDRQALHAALITDSWTTLRAAIKQAGPATDSALEVIQRIISAMVHSGDRVSFLFAATEGVPSEADAGIAQEADELILAEIKRGQREGALDSTVPARWIVLMIWSTVHVGLQAAVDGLVPRHGVDELVRRTLRRAVGEQPE